MLRAAGRFYDGAVAVLGVTLMVVIVTTMGVQVFFRYVLNDSLIWAEELSSYMLVLMSFLLLGAAFQRGEMMNLTMLTDRLPWRAATALRLPVMLAIAGFLIYLSWYGYKFSLLNRNSTIPALDFIVSSITGVDRTLVVSRFWLYLIIPIGFIGLAIHCLVEAGRCALVLAGRRAPHQHGPDTDSKVG